MPSATSNTLHPPIPSAAPVNPPDLSSKLPRLTPRRRATPPSNPLPVPKTPMLPPPPPTSSYKFTKPTRRILSPKDHTIFLQSPTYDLVLSFVFTLTDSVQDKPVSSIKPSDLSPTVNSILGILDEAEKVVERCPPEDQGGSRFGNKGFRSFIDALGEECAGWHRRLGITDEGAVEEASMYFLQSFGNRTRIDYGSGHELNFMIWLLCLNRLTLLPPSTFPSLALHIFTRYLTLMRTLQSLYYLEPAGSHGVWGLDDYQFLPFLFGSSQLLSHAFIRPLSIHQSLILEEYGADYMYLGQVQFVNSVKNVEGLRWHSPMLDDISAAKSWGKVEGGMRRMFVKEVLGKLPVMQHFLFGSLVPAIEGTCTEEDVGLRKEEEEVEGGEVSVAEDGTGAGGVVMKDGMRHVHQSNSWGDCCGIKVPSSVGAAEEMRKRMGGGEGLRRVPFD
ncbi:MAG: Serine/threonine-protein phosphatase 2A activator 2 [Pycnora praestabilis]|nr:MAG: Serine/threonine-protein phosphatase 2A activator 2 [Pycnora praestabilis]